MGTDTFASKDRNIGYDLIKIIATITIVLHHYQLLGGIIYDNGMNFYGGRFNFGYVVELFFIISGILTYSYVSKINNGMSFKDFYIGKCIRLLPMVIVTALSWNILFYIYYRISGMYLQGAKLTLWGTVTDMLGIQAGGSFMNPMINNPTWYISVLLICYCFFYISVFIANRLGISPIYFWIMLIFVGCGVISYGINLPFLNEYSARGYYSFFTGLLIATFIFSEKYIIYNKKLSIIGFLVMLSILVLIVCKWTVVEDGINFTMTFVFYPCLIFVASPINEILSRSKAISSIIAVLSNISYGVYLWHATLLIASSIVAYKLTDVSILGKRTTMALFVIICFVWALMSYYLIEKPVTRFLRGGRRTCNTTNAPN